eukprot:363169-Chlamydomonas_euryale.AAC.21
MAGTTPIASCPASQSHYAAHSSKGSRAKRPPLTCLDDNKVTKYGRPQRQDSTPPRARTDDRQKRPRDDDATDDSAHHGRRDRHSSSMPQGTGSDRQGGSRERRSMHDVPIDHAGWDRADRRVRDQPYRTSSRNDQQQTATGAGMHADDRHNIKRYRMQDAQGCQHKNLAKPGAVHTIVH